MLFAFNNPHALNEMKNYAHRRKADILEFQKNYGKFNFLDPDFIIECYMPLNILSQLKDRETGIFEVIYSERADKNFINLAKDPDIHTAFESIRKKI